MGLFQVFFWGMCYPNCKWWEGGVNGTGCGIILKLYIYIYKDIFLHLFFALCALKALDKSFGFAFLSSMKLEAFFKKKYFPYKSSCLVACLSSPSPAPHDEVPFLLCLPSPSSEVLRGTRCPSLSVEIKNKKQRMCNIVWHGSVPALN
uniref:Uncharacterized protein n=1 Tax=Myotis myotis TaxID=51298 RepID=A0A7J7SSC7_MYOMY|nr:hypothetical protein mMyoMyo1_009367 [Myotis myotis]